MQFLLTGPHTSVRVDRLPRIEQSQSSSRQRGLRQFFQQTAQCLSCKRPITRSELEKVKQSALASASCPSLDPEPTASVQTSLCSPGVSVTSRSQRVGSSIGEPSHVMRSPGQDQDDDLNSLADPCAIVPPGLCEDCARREGTWEEVYSRTLSMQQAYQQDYGRAASQCIACHSGGLTGRIICENSECPLFYSRIESARKLKETQHILDRLDW